MEGKKEAGDVLPDTMRRLTADALAEYAASLTRESRSRKYAGPRNAGIREQLRETAADCHVLEGMTRQCDALELARVLKDETGITGEDVTAGAGPDATCGCGEAITWFEGAWLHIFNPELRGTDDHEAEPDDPDSVDWSEYEDEDRDGT